MVSGFRLSLLVIVGSLGCAAIAGLEDDYVVGAASGTAASTGGTDTTGTGTAAATGSASGAATGSGSSGNGIGEGGAGGTAGSDGAAGAVPSGGAGGGTVVGYCDEVGLVACYRFEGSGQDGSVEGNHASVTGLQYVTGQAGQAARFDAASSVTIPPDDSFGLGALTLELWLRPATLPASGRFGLVDHPGRWSAWLRPDGVYCRSVGPAPIPTGSWSHIACVNDGATMHLYVDGQQITSGASALDPNPTSATIHLGSDAPDGGDPYLGDMDEVRLFDHVRSAEQVCVAAGGTGC